MTTPSPEDLAKVVFDLHKITGQGDAISKPWDDLTEGEKKLLRDEAVYHATCGPTDPVTLLKRSEDFRIETGQITTRSDLDKVLDTAKSVLDHIAVSFGDTPTIKARIPF